MLEGKSGYVLRVLQPETSNRALLKGFVGGVLDVAFAHRGSSLLAAVDEGGNVYVWDLSRVEEITKAPTYPMTMLFYIYSAFRGAEFSTSKFILLKNVVYFQYVDTCTLLHVCTFIMK